MRQNAVGRILMSEPLFATAFLLSLFLAGAFPLQSGILPFAVLVWYAIARSNSHDLIRLTPWFLLATTFLGSLVLFAEDRAAACIRGGQALLGMAMVFPALVLARMRREALLPVAAALALLLIVGAAVWLALRHFTDLAVPTEAASVPLAMLFILSYALILDLPRCVGRRLLALGMFLVIFCAYKAGDAASLIGMGAAALVMTALVFPRAAYFVVVPGLVWLGIASQRPDGLAMIAGWWQALHGVYGAVWSNATDQIGQSPFVGHGLTALGDAGLLSPAGGSGSFYLDLLFVSGLVGAAFWALWYFSFGVRLTVLGSSGLQLARVWGAGLVSFVLVQGLLTGGFYGLYPTFLLSAGLAWSLTRIIIKKKR